MVHCLAVLRRLNEEAAKKERGRRGYEANAPTAVARGPAALRAFLNRPWTDRELRGDQNVHETYAKSAAEPFERREGKIEGLRA